MDSLIQQNKLRLNSDVLEKNSKKKKTDSSEEYLVSQISLEKTDLATISTAENTEQTEYTPVSLDNWVSIIHEGNATERTRDVCCQSFIPFLIAGLGSIGAGLLFNHVQKFPIICAVPQFITLSPPLQGMKGNLDMTFTSRLSTMAHQGQLDSVNGRVTYVLRNMALIQAQAILISSFATVLTFLLSLLNTISDIEPLATNFLFLGSNALMAMSSACAIMAIAMVSLVMISRAAGINPDNVATPLAASIGDLLTIGSMLGFGIIYYPITRPSLLIPIGVIIVFCLLIPIWLKIASGDEGAWKAAHQQWPTLLLAAVLSSGAGFIQSWAVIRFPEITAYQPLITGVAGNRTALQSSRISTHLHLNKINNQNLTKRWNPFKYYKSKDGESSAARLLLFTAMPYQVIFVFISHGISHILGTPLHLNGWFISGYILAAFIQISFLLFLCQFVVYTLWRLQIDPDLHAIPILTSTGDIIGTALLTALFYILKEINANIVLYVPGNRRNSTTSIC